MTLPRVPEVPDTQVHRRLCRPESGLCSTFPQLCLPLSVSLREPQFGIYKRKLEKETDERKGTQYVCMCMCLHACACVHVYTHVCVRQVCFGEFPKERREQRTGEMLWWAAQEQQAMLLWVDTTRSQSTANTPLTHTHYTTPRHPTKDVHPKSQPPHTA